MASVCGSLEAIHAFRTSSGLNNRKFSKIIVNTKSFYKKTAEKLQNVCDVLRQIVDDIEDVVVNKLINLRWLNPIKSGVEIRKVARPGRFLCIRRVICNFVV